MSVPSLVGVLVTMALLNVSPVLPLLRTEMRLSNFQASLALAATLLPHAAIQIPGGNLIDAWGSRKSLLLALGVAAAGTLAAGVAPGFELLLAARALMGIGTGLAIIAGLVLSRELSGPGKGILSQGIFGAMLNVGTLLVLVSAPIGISFGWRFTFIAEGILLAALLVFCLLLLPPSVRTENTAPASWRGVLGNRGIYALTAAHSATYSLFVTLAAWAPTFLQHQYSMPLASAGILSAWLTVSAIVFRGISGLVPPNRRGVVILGSATASVALTFLLPLAPSPEVAISILFLLGAATSFPFAAIFSSAGVLSGPAAVGRGSGFVSAGSNVGALLFPPVIGYSVDVTGAFLPGYWVVGAVGVLLVALMMSQLGGAAARSRLAEAG
ncbi:MAG TPA: MFS transporter [Chloroflexota bacterium]